MDKEKEMKRLIIVTIGVMLMSTQVLAFDLMGPTTSRLKDSGKTSVGAEYFWGSMDIDADGIPELGLISDTIKDVDFDKISANFALGMGRGSEIFLRLGVAEAEPDKGDNRDNVAGYIGSSDECFFIGGGAKWTLYEEANFGWGLLTQVSWADFDFDQQIYSIGGYNVNFSTDVEIVEVQISTGPTLKLTKDLTFFGGPFLHFLNGDMELKGSIDGLSGSISTDLDQESLLGGYIGAELGLGQNAIISFEVQGTSGNYGMGGQLVWKF
ncbi:MAG: hypothetical protein WBC05_03050 [Sedimentisphaerales bacterium]